MHGWSSVVIMTGSERGRHLVAQKKEQKRTCGVQNTRTQIFEHVLMNPGIAAGNNWFGVVVFETKAIERH